MEEQPNLTYLKELSGGDEEFERKLLNVLKVELPQEIRSYKLELKQGNLIAAADLVHKLKHKISILGLEKSYQIAVDYEEELKLEKIDSMENFEKVLETMVSFINRH